MLLLFSGNMVFNNMIWHVQFVGKEEEEETRTNVMSFEIPAVTSFNGDLEDVLKEDEDKQSHRKSH